MLAFNCIRTHCARKCCTNLVDLKHPTLLFLEILEVFFRLRAGEAFVFLQASEDRLSDIGYGPRSGQVESRKSAARYII